MARPREFDETQALEAAASLFRTKGFDGASMSELEQALGLTRTSIYNSFGNKDELYQKAMEHYCQQMFSQLIARLEDSPTAREGLEQLLNCALGSSCCKNGPGGCLIALTALECEQHSKDTRAAVNNSICKLEQAIRNRLRQGKKDKEFSKSFDEAAAATAVVGLINGFAVLGKAGVSTAKMKKAVGVFLEAL